MLSGGGSRIQNDSKEQLPPDVSPEQTTTSHTTDSLTPCSNSARRGIMEPLPTRCRSPSIPAVSHCVVQLRHCFPPGKKSIDHGRLGEVLVKFRGCDCPTEHPMRSPTPQQPCTSSRTAPLCWSSPIPKGSPPDPWFGGILVRDHPARIAASSAGRRQLRRLHRTQSPAHSGRREAGRGILVTADSKESLLLSLMEMPKHPN